MRLLEYPSATRIRTSRSRGVIPPASAAGALAERLFGLAGTGIAGRYKKLVAFGALANFPGEGAFPSARTEEQDVHGAKDREMCGCADGLDLKIL